MNPYEPQLPDRRKPKPALLYVIATFTAIVAIMTIVGLWWISTNVTVIQVLEDRPSENRGEHAK